MFIFFELFVLINFTKITDKELYCLMLQGGKYFKDIENRNPGSWKGLLTNITAGGELNSQTKIALIDVTDGIGAYYRNTYNADGYGEDSPTKKNAVSEIGKNERELVIRCFEECHPDQAKSLDTFFSKSFNRDGNTMREAYLTDKYKEDIANIKYITYSAPEPYQSLFLDNVAKERILCNSGDPDFQMNLIPFNGIAVDLDNAANDQQGPYATFFHELGHGIDDLMYIGGNYSSHYTEDIAKFPGMEGYYEGKTEVTLKQVLEYDCADYVKIKIDTFGNTLDEESKIIALNLLLSNREDRDAYVDYSMLYRSKTDSDREAIDQAISAVKKDLTKGNGSELYGEQNSLASDVYGGVSFNQLKGLWGHDPWYWLLYDGGMTSREATADYFSMQMTGDTKAMESVEKFLGNSSQMLGEMFDSMAEKEGIIDETQQ